MMTSPAYHLPVMLEETLQQLVTRPDGVYVDGTFGGGGHARSLLERFSQASVIGIDRDEEALKEAQALVESVNGRLTVVRDNFSNIDTVLSQLNRTQVDGVLLDLGVSSHQFDDRSRGFSFSSPVLDMRMDRREQAQAEDLLNDLSEEELADVFYRYGEEHRSRPISRRIVEERRRARITSGEMLAKIVESVKHRSGKIHPATQVFQALRIAVNRELESLETFLAKLPSVLANGGRAVVISYHSLEDRIVKLNFRSGAQEGKYRLINKKVICATETEQHENPRSRSAKLRAVEKL